MTDAARILLRADHRDLEQARAFQHEIDIAQNFGVASLVHGRDQPLLHINHDQNGLVALQNEFAHVIVHRGFSFAVSAKAG